MLDVDFTPVADFKSSPNIVISRLTDELDAFLYFERTGVKVMEDIRFPWKKLLDRLEMSVEAVDKDKVSDYLREQFDEWLKTRPLPLRLEPEFAKELPSLLHTLLKDACNEMKIQPASIMVASWTRRPFDMETLAFVGDQIRLFLGTDQKHFQLSGQTIFRIADDRGRPTDVVIHRNTSAIASDQVVKRFTSTIREAFPGLTQEQFHDAKRHHNARLTFGQLQAYVARHTKAQEPEPPPEPEPSEPEPSEPEIPIHPNDALAERILEILGLSDPITFTQLVIAIGPRVAGHHFTDSQIKGQMRRLREAGRIQNDGGRGPGVKWSIVRPKKAKRAR